MKSKFFLACALAAISLTTISCSKDDDDVKADVVPEGVGALTSGTSLDNALPNGYRLASVDDCVFFYNNDGSLNGFDWDGESVHFQDGKLVYEFDGAKTSISLNKQGLITQASESFEYHDEYESGKGTGSMKCSYNSNSQLTSLSLSGTEEYIDEGFKGKFTFKMSCNLTYAGSKLSKVTVDIEEAEAGYKETEKDNITFSYDENYPNPFGQYTARIINNCFAEMLPEPLAYLGLFGRASSELPTSMTIVEECTEDGEKETDNHTLNCGPYVYNSYGALAEADGRVYTYTTLGGARSVSAQPAGKYQGIGLAQWMMKRHKAHKNRK